MKNTAIAWLGSDELKARIVSQVRRHSGSEQIIKGKYWEHERGCAVGCILHDPSGGHARFPAELGIPTEVALLVDSIFEGLSASEAKKLPLQFVEAIPVGADLALVISRFLVWLLSDLTDGAIRHADAAGRAAIETVAGLHQRLIDGGTVSRAEWVAAGDAASEAASTASFTARAASYAAFYASSAAVRDAACGAAACEAAKAASFTASVARAVSAASVARAVSAASAANDAARRKQSDTLIRLLRSA